MTSEPVAEPGHLSCPHCGRFVPPLHYCVRCGSPLEAGRRRREFAAEPGEPARALRLFSTLFPHLPQAGYETFRHAFVLGILVVAGLAIAGLYPLALVASALVLPALFVLYFIEVDLYERAPATVVAATIAWGVLVGAILGNAVRLLSGPGAADTTTDPSRAVPGAVVLAVLGSALALIGPLSLIRDRAFNDVLDGATFGAISGAAYAATAAVVRAGDLLGAGLRPGGDPLPWLLRLATLGISQPILLAALTGSICAAFWLRYRAPVRDRAALGGLGSPALAILGAAGLLAAAATSRTLLDLAGGLLATTVAAAIGLLWLRAVIHVGLLEEANEAEVGPPIRCPNCGRTTPSHTFCGWCGISLQAAPRRRPATPAKPASAPADPPRPAR